PVSGEGNGFSTLRYWARHVDFIAKTFGDLVSGWQPVNETNYYPTAAFLSRGWPPGHNDIGEWSLASQQIQLASADIDTHARSRPYW
ncbi:MAG: family 1 glycosylhydrolase, partial [Xanthomonadales bacterium]|nr:family 1 glycosylhydrolase [Xanthomonadales bacterium]